MKKSFQEIRNYYKDQPSGSCIKLLTDIGNEQIVLIRHARPDVDRPRRVDFNEAEKYLTDYRKSGIIPFEEYPVCTENLPAMRIYCSTLERARQTARHLFPSPKFDIVEDARLRELDRENIRIPFRVSHKMHTTLSRISWLLGIKKAEENLKAAMQRIKDGADNLNQLSENENLIIVVAHGFQNYFLARKLRQLGWKMVFDNGNAHLSVKILAK